MSKIILAGGDDGTGSVTVQAPATNSNRVLTLPDVTGTIMVDGPAFSAVRITSNQSISSSVWTKVQFNSEEFDTNNFFDLTTSRFTPTVAGYYQFNSAVYMQYSGSIVNNSHFVSFYKNGVIFKYGSGLAVASSSLVTHASALIYLNGSTDYVEVYGYCSGSSSVINADPALTYFQGALVRSAT